MARDGPLGYRRPVTDPTDTAVAADPRVGGCRECPVRCTRVVYVSRCVAGGCPHLYAAERFGRRVMGCLQGVFSVAS